MSELVETLLTEFTDREYAHAYLEENSNLRIAAQVRAMRINRGWSQQELAEKSSMRQERISKIEMGDFDSLTLKTLRRLSEAFDVHLSVQFSSVHTAIVDFMSLSEDTLVCEDRETSLENLSLARSIACSIVTPTTPNAVREFTVGAASIAAYSATRQHQTAISPPDFKLTIIE